MKRLAHWFMRVAASLAGFEFSSQFNSEDSFTGDIKPMAIVFAVNRKCYEAVIAKASQLERAK